jgi:uncharacterized protein YcbX
MKARTIVSLHRFPVKSMQGEHLDEIQIAAGGVVGDRAFAIIDRSDGRIATAKHPRKWGVLLELCARYNDTPSDAPRLGQIDVDFPDGARYRGDSPALRDALTRFTGRDVELLSGDVPDAHGEMVWPDVKGYAPQQVIDAVATEVTEDGDRLGDWPMGSRRSKFVDATDVHLLTTSTLRALATHDPEVTFDERRFRPNVLLEVAEDGFVENDWPGATLTFSGGAALLVDNLTVRCVMTTLAQPGLGKDRRVLQTLARVNRVEVPQYGGAWACAGVAATVVTGGPLRLADDLVSINPSDSPKA